MRKLLFVLILAPLLSFSQVVLEVRKGKFYKGDQPLSVKNFVMEMKDNPKAFELASSAQGGYNTSNMLGFIGGFMVGWPLGTAIAGGEPEWGLAAAGAGVLAIAIPIASSSTKKIKEAANIYNNGLGTSSTKMQLNFNVSPAKTGFILSF